MHLREQWRVQEPPMGGGDFNFANFSDPEKPPETEFEHGLRILEGFLGLL